MTLKKERVKFARFIRRHCKLSLPESVKIAKLYLRHGFWEYESLPPSLIVKYESKCGEPGCCYGEVYYLPLKVGRNATLNWLYDRFYAEIHV